MRNKFFVTILLVLLFQACNNIPTNSDSGQNILYEKLNAIEEFEVIEVQTQDYFSEVFVLRIRQPLDHNNPGAGDFVQNIYLSHYSETAPVVFITNGNALIKNSVSELSYILNANQILVAHRFFDGARPGNLDWQYLTVEQAAADYHRIVTLLKEIYTGLWISGGDGKGAIAALEHRRHYPDDIFATISNSAPFMNSTEDSRIENYILNEAGTEECRNGIWAFQRKCLQCRGELLSQLYDYRDSHNLHFSFGEGAVLEYAIADYPICFWQKGNGPVDVPSENITAIEMFEELEDVVDFWNYTDESHYYYAGHYYQAFTQLGYYRYITDNISDLLISLENPTYEIFGPPNIDMVFDPTVIPDLLNWVTTEGNNTIYIYGGIDPYSITAPDVSGQTNAIIITDPNCGYSPSIYTLPNTELFYSTLETWLGLTCNRIPHIESIQAR